MVVKRVCCFLFLVLVLCGSLVVSSEYWREETFLTKLVDPVTGEVDDHLAELLWISCREDLIHLNGEVEELSLCLLEEMPSRNDEIKSGSQLLAHGNIQKLNNLLHPCLKQTLLQCIRKNNLLFRVTREGGSWYTTYFKSLFPRFDVPRRKLRAQLRRSAAEIPTGASGLAGAPASTPALTPAPTPSKFPARVSKPPAPSSSKPFFPLDSIPPPAIEESSSTTSGSGANASANKDKNSHKTIIIAVVVTAVVTFVLAALLFLCCSRLFRNSSGDRRNDERPLLSLSMSDYSIGSGNSVKEEKLGHQSVASHDNKVSSLDGKFYLGSNLKHTSLDESASLEAVGGTTKSSAESLDVSSTMHGQVLPPLKPPPGRVGATPPGMPPVKPPSGRAEPLPPEPPASIRPPAPPPPPPPPPPPVPPLKSSGDAGPTALKPPPPPPMAPGVRPGPPPPPPLKGGPSRPRPPPPMPGGSKVPRPPLGSKHPSASSEGAGMGSDADAHAPKTKLKPFFWDKVLANPDHSMVWHQIKSGSFQFNEEMIETLFGYAANDKRKNDGKKDSSLDQGPHYIQIIDPKKAQNLAIMLRALNVTMEEVCDALHEGNELPAELLQTLLKMAPTAEEELKLRLYSGEVSQLGPAERFLKALVDIPYAFKRLEALHFMCSLQEEVTVFKESFETLEVACKELRNSRLFLKLLEAVLKTGNRMNDGTFRGGAQAFKLDTLLKLSDVKGVDGKTTLLHFVVQEIIRSEGVRAARAARSSSFSSVKSDDLLQEISQDTEEHYRSLGLQAVSHLSSELENVKKAAALDAESLTGNVSKLGHSLLKARDFLNSEMKSSEETSGFHETLKSFVQNAEVDVMWLLEEEKRIMSLVKSTGDYFHGNARKDEGLRLFIIVRDFLIILDKACREVREAQKRAAKSQKKEASTGSSSADLCQQPSPDLRRLLFPAIAERRMDGSSSDEESS